MLKRVRIHGHMSSPFKAALSNWPARYLYVLNTAGGRDCTALIENLVYAR